MDIGILFDLILLTAIGASYYLLSNSLPTYFSEKGKNLATKQDIGDITDEIESIKKIYQTELEELKASLAQDREITNLALQARNISLSSFGPQKVKAIQKMWDLMVELRNNSAFELTQVDFLKNSSTYEKEVFNPNFRNSKESRALNINRISLDINEAFRKLRKDEVWLGQSLWKKFSSYVSIISIIRLEFLKFLKGEGNLDLNNSELTELLSEFYPDEIINEYDFLKNFSSVTVVLNSLEREILNEINDIQTGKTATRETLEHAKRIAKAKQRFS